MINFVYEGLILFLWKLEVSCRSEFEMIKLDIENKMLG